MLGEERRKTANACTEMADIRYEIDRLDRSLVRLLAERQTYIEAAGRIKRERGTVRDEARIEDVVSKVLASAAHEGLSRDIAEPVWRLLIDRCIAHEFRVFDRLNPGQARRAAGGGVRESRTAG
ncbi:MAG: chorismate mutase [bacterium]